MRILIIIFFGILSYLIVVLPGYYLIVPVGIEKITTFKTLVELPTLDTDKSSKLSLANPGNEPPLK